MRTASESDVVPSACSPAKSTAVFTCALGIGVVKSMALSGVPVIVIGACPSVSSSFAPICLSGLRMRSIGRSVSEWSPISVNIPRCGAISPESMRIVEPELPQSSGAEGWWKLPPTPVTSMAAVAPSPVRTTFAPRASMQPSEECGSAPVEKFVSREVPSARQASIA